MKSNKVMIFGGGLNFNGDTTRLAEASRQRAETFLQQYYAHEKQFGSREAYVVCTGGYGLLAAGVTPPAEHKWREGPLLADMLLENGVPGRLIRVEDDSISTITNLTYSLDGGYIDVTDFSPESPLGLVSHPRHLDRVGDAARRLSITDIEKIPTTQEDDRTREALQRAAYKMLLLGAYGTEALEHRERLVAELVAKIRK